MFDLPRSLWREPRPAPPSAPRVWWDWVLVGVLVPVGVLEGVFRPDLSWRALSVVVTVGLLPTLLWRRTRPLLVIAIAMGVCFVASLAVGAEFPQQNTLASLLLLAFALLRWGSGREAVLGAAIFLGKVGSSAALGYLRPADALGGAVVLVLAMTLGAAVRYRSRARARELDQVKLLERERLARDLHDTVAHHVSAMAIRAQAGIATAATDPNAAVDALHLIDAEAARALDDMRGMVRLLRATDLSGPPTSGLTSTEIPATKEPGISARRREDPTRLPIPRHPRPAKRRAERGDPTLVADLERLTSHTRPPVEVRVDGDADSLPSPVGTTVYRLAQEAVTNARRHARNATRIEVRVDVDDTSVRVRVSDDGEPVPPRGSRGYGLTGMVERANLLGGTCEAGPGAERGWTVSAVLPRT